MPHLKAHCFVPNTFTPCSCLMHQPQPAYPTPIPVPLPTCAQPPVPTYKHTPPLLLSCACPGCLQVYQGVLQQKLCDLVHSGITVTVNSDDPAFLGGYINTNYAWLAETTGLSPEELAQLAKNSFQASFISEEAKKQAMAAVDAALHDWGQQHHGWRDGWPS